MKHLFIPYELAVIAKEKGFDEACIATYTQGTIGKGDKLQFFHEPINDNNDFTFVYAPLYQQIVDWFREKKQLHILIELTDNTRDFYYQYTLVDSKNREYHDEDMIDQATSRTNYELKFNSYYEALNKAIEEAFKLI